MNTCRNRNRSVRELKNRMGLQGIEPWIFSTSTRRSTTEPQAPEYTGFIGIIKFT